MLPLRARFQVSEYIYDSDVGGFITLLPVVRDEDNQENKNFYKTIPAGTITLSLASRETAIQFKMGEEYYVDFTPVVPVVPDDDK